MNDESELQIGDEPGHHIDDSAHQHTSESSQVFGYFTLDIIFLHIIGETIIN